ncbi:MAG: DNA methyltransferase [Beijerinckiaceae bacterium]
MNRLYYGDNLEVLRNEIKDESVDLVYLDPPFNSQASYNVLFKAPSGEESHAQIEAFEDTWHWGEAAEHAFDEVMTSGNSAASELLRALRAFLHENDMMAYLAMMAVRLLELHRVLKPNGSLYLHCDPTASHYLKLLLDSIFGVTNFRNEIIWKRKAGRGETNVAAIRFGVSHDILLFYAKSDSVRLNRQYRVSNEVYIESKFTHVDENGRRYRLDNLTSPSPRPNLTYKYKGYAPPVKGWAVSKETMEKMEAAGRLYFPKDKTKRIQRIRFLDELLGETVDTLWDDIPPINSQARERLGYPTQKPVALLERIINASSGDGDIVLDPFCGCGTTIHAAQKLKRPWIGIDITHLAISLIEKRLNDAFPGIEYEVHGTPKDLDGARNLAERDKYQFQWWAVSLVNAVPFGGKKKGADTGIDGLIYFKDFRGGKITTEKIVVSVKGGENVSVAMIRDLAHVVDRENAKMGLFVTLAEPTDPMRKEALTEGYFETSAGGKFLKLQIATIEQLLAGKKPDLPSPDPGQFAKAEKEAKQQGKLL